MKKKNNRNDMPTRSVIFNYWVKHLNMEQKGFDSLTDMSDACFACGMIYKNKLDRAHILPLCNGGTNNVNNIHLLCHHCHKASEMLHGDLYWEWFYERTVLDVILQCLSRNGINLSKINEYDENRISKIYNFLNLKY